MLRLSENIKIFIANPAIDFRKAINGLCALVYEAFSELPKQGALYVFYNRSQDKVKCLFWDRNGFVLYQKRLERGKFKFGKGSDGRETITPQQLDWLLAGLDFRLMHEFSDLDFSHYF